MKHNDNDFCMRARSTCNKKKRLLSAFLSFSIVLSLFSSSSMASVEVNTGASLSAPPVTGTFSVSSETSGSYVEPVNTYSDGNPVYYLVTQDAAKSSWTTVTYNGVVYPLAGVQVGSNINAMGSVFAANSTVFFDSGTYNDGDANAYTRYSNTNFSMVGLYKDASGEPTVKITKATRTDSGKVSIERNIVMHTNVYYENLIFDGLNNNMLAYASSGAMKNRGEFFFYFSGVASPWNGSAGFVMKDCIIQNIGGATTSDGNRNVAMNFYCSAGQHNFENIKIRNIKTLAGYGIISFNQSSENYFKNITIDGSLASTSSTSVKIETKAAALPYNTIMNVFSGNLNLTQAGLLNLVYIQDFGYKSTVLPSEYRYAQYSTSNGSSYSSAVNVYKTLPAAAANKAVLDLTDNYWVVRSAAELAYIKTIMTRVASAGGSVPGPTIKFAANSGKLDSFTVPDFGDIDVNIVAVSSAADLYTSTALIPLAAAGTITLPAANYQKIRLYNFDFDTNARYTLKEATDGINPAAVTLNDPNESGFIAGYPFYSTYRPAAVTAAKVTRSSTDTFVNCRFTSLAREIEMINTVTKLAVGSSTTFTAALTGSDTNSYTGSGYTGNIKGTANDQTIIWFSSDPSIVSIDKTTGLAIANAAGNVTITAKALDANNNGEIEKPFAVFLLQAAAPYTVTYYGNSNTSGNMSSPVNTYLDGDTITILDKDTLVKDMYRFIGWNTQAPGDGTAYQPGDSLVITGDMDLFAQWELIPPTVTPTDVPTTAPTDVPTTTPTDVPTITPTDVPTITPTGTPTNTPTVTPTAEPTPVQIANPEASPTPSPSPSPSPSPTQAPAVSPTPGSGVLGADRNTTPVPTASPKPSTDVLGANSSLTRTGEMGNAAYTFAGFSVILSGGLMTLLIRRRKK